MSLLEVYFRALRYLVAQKQRVFFICAANVVLAIVTIAEPILFGQVIDSIADKREVLPTLALWAGLGAFNIVAYVLVARGADRMAHALRASVLCKS
ncbi:MAG: glucan ABC transporter ATP-binding protein/ permease, partial [Pseudaminobacter sp.]